MSCYKLMFFAALLLAGHPAACAQAVSQVSGSFGLGSQQFGLNVSESPVSGGVWGYTTHTQFTAVELQYGVSLTHGRSVRLWYTPQLVPFNTLYEGAGSQSNPAVPVRDYAAGARPVGLQLAVRRGGRVQPFVDTHEGFLYYNRRVLSPGGSQFMFTLDFGAGTRIFASERNCINVSYRYQHQSNANISLHNPGTDGHTITVGFSHFTRQR